MDDVDLDRLDVLVCFDGWGLMMIPDIALTLETKGGLKWLLKKY